MEINCKGSYLNGTACQSCSKCDKELKRITNALEQSQDIDSIKEENKKLKQMVEIIKESCEIDESSIVNIVEILIEINKIHKFILIDEDGTVGFIKKVSYDQLCRCDNGEVNIIDFSGEEPKRLRLSISGWVEIENFDETQF